MSDKMSMSLDEIISSTRTSRGGAGNRAQLANRRYNGGTTTLVRRGGSLPFNRGQQRNGNYGQRNVYAGYARAAATGGVQKSFRAGPKRLFDMAVNTTTLSGGPTALMVSNLDFGVTDTDIRELFADFGPLIKAAVHYDRSGRSLGTADVVYERASDALKAVKQYNGIPLDGRPMNIQYATSHLPIVAAPPLPYYNGVSTYRGYGGRPSVSRGAGIRRSQMRGPVRGGSQSRRSRSDPTAEELDAELDAYVNRMQL